MASPRLHGCNFPANGYFEWEACPGHELAQPSGISLGITHSECSETRSYTENALLSGSTICFFVPRGAEIIGAAERYLNSLPPATDLTPGRITPRSYGHKAKQRFREPLFTRRCRGGPPRSRQGQSHRRRDKADLGPWRGTVPPGPLPFFFCFWGRDAGRSPRASRKDEARVERDVRLAVGLRWGMRGLFFRGHRGSRPLFATVSAEAFASSESVHGNP